MTNSYKVIGLMSGTSLDGVDIAYCEFNFSGKWTFILKKAETIAYDERWQKMLGGIHSGTASEISKLDCDYGVFLGQLVNNFLSRNPVEVDFISSHGHTIYHQPANGLTRQIGSGAYLSSVAGLDVVCDFRSQDVALGGQGAPLVPVGDMLLFSDADYCLNLGGIANISFDKNGQRKAFDICACNLILNKYASLKGFPFDKDGMFAENGKVNKALLDVLNSIPYYSLPFPKSLGRENVEADIIPLIDREGIIPEDILATFCEHIAVQISKITSTGRSMLISGGGALNKHLVKKIEEYSKATIIIPERNIIEYKEAIIFAFLGVLRIRGEVNCLKSVTGAISDSSSGAIYKKNS